MRHKLSFALGILLGAALVQLFARGRHTRRPEVRDPRTEELRRRLAEQRANVRRPTPAAASTSSPPGPPDPAPSHGVADGRDVTADRRRIYEEGRAAVDEMRRSGEPPEMSD